MEVKHYTEIRSIPFDKLCPVCNRGWLIPCGMQGEQKRMGEHFRKYSVYCDFCGRGKRIVRKYFGVVVGKGHHVQRHSR